MRRRFLPGTGRPYWLLLGAGAEAGAEPASEAGAGAGWGARVIGTVMVWVATVPAGAGAGVSLPAGSALFSGTGAPGSRSTEFSSTLLARSRSRAVTTLAGAMT